MFIHLGGSRMIRIRDVIAILDANAHLTGYIDIAKREGRVEQISLEEMKSYVITSDKVYASPISSMTLKKRAQESQKYLK